MVVLRSLRASRSKISTNVSDDASFLFGIVNALETRQKELGTINHCEIDALLVAESFLDLLGFALTQQSIIDKQGLESITDCPMHQDSGDGGIDSATDGTDADTGGSDL